MPDGWSDERPPGEPLRYRDLFPGDDVLTSYLERTSTFNVDLIEAREILTSRRAAARAASAARLPILSYGVSTESRSNDGTGTARVGAEAGAAFDPDVFGRLRLRARSARVREAMACLEARRIEEVLRSEVLGAYVEGKTAMRLAEIERGNLRYLQEIRRVAEERLRVGTATRAEVALADLEVRASRATISQFDLSVFEARQRLSLLMGGAGIILPDLPRGLPEPARGDSWRPMSPALLVAYRGDVAASRLAVAEALISARIVRADELPSAVISADIIGSSGAGAFDLAPFVTTLGARLADVVFTGGAARFRVDEAAALARASLARYETVLRSAIANVRTEERRLEQAIEAEAQFVLATAGAAAALEAEQLRYETGETTLIDVLIVQRRLAQLQQAATGARGDVYAATSRLILATGTNPALARSSDLCIE